MPAILMILLAAAMMAGCSMSETPTPDYRVLQTAADGAIEVRAYPAMPIAEVTVSGDRGGAANQGFRQLADYIFGGNRAGEKIAMTAPVLQEPLQETRQGREAPAVEGTQWHVQFIMPPGATLDALPAPRDSSVTVRTMPAQRLAVLRFSGFNRESRLAEKEAELLAWMKRTGLQRGGPTRFAFYDPPWTPWFMKRNEVMVPLAEKDDGHTAGEPG